MIGLKRSGIRLLIKIYVALSLVAGVVFSPLEFSFVPSLFLAIFLYSWFRPPRPLAAFTLNLYLFIALPLIYESIVVAELSPFFSLPILALLDLDLERLASTYHFEDSRFKRQPSKLLVSLALVVVISLAIAVFLGKYNLLIACAFLAGYLLFLIIRLLAAIPQSPIDVDKAQYKVIAGHNISFTVPLLNRLKLGGWLYLATPHEFIKLKHHRFPLNQDIIELHVSLTPPLAGPSTVNVTAFVLDRCGLIQTKFPLELAELLVIPRAKYAAWLARRYLETTRAGLVTPMASGTTVFRRSTGSRSGAEYYANRFYQPGDSLRSISWKHSLKLNEIVVKEFDSPQASSAALLINLTVANADEADRLVYTWLITSITLAREGIPTMLAVYNHEDVLTVTGFLDSRQVVLRSLMLSREVVIWAQPQKYLKPPDPLRIRADISRLRMANMDSVTKLIELLDMEYKALCDYAASNPATKAVNAVLAKSSSRATFAFISAENHDVEALQMAKYRLKTRNLRFTEISLDGNATKADKTPGTQISDNASELPRPLKSTDASISFKPA